MRLTARSPEDLLAIAPVVLGFWPSRSVVMLTFGAAAPFHARVDLPEPGRGAGDPALREELAGLVDLLLEPASRHRVERVVLLVYSDDADLGGAAWRVLRRACERRRLPVVEALRVGARRWYPLLGADRSTREIGVAFEVAHHRFVTQAVLEGRVTHASRADLAALTHPVVDQVARVEAWAGRPASYPLAASTLTSTDRDVLLAEGEWVEALVADHLARGATPSDPDAARLLLAVRSARLRDAALLLVDRANASGAVRLFTGLLQRCPEPLVPAAAVLLGWSAWLAGDGALAWCALDRCRAVDPDYGLAALLDDALSRAVPPSVWPSGVGWRDGLD